MLIHSLYEVNEATKVKKKAGQKTWKLEGRDTGREDKKEMEEQKFPGEQTEREEKSSIITHKKLKTYCWALKWCGQHIVS